MLQKTPKHSFRDAGASAATAVATPSCTCLGVSHQTYTASQPIELLARIHVCPHRGLAVS
jgi:hypothetical protein